MKRLFMLLLAFLVSISIASASCCYNSFACIEEMDEQTCLNEDMIWTPLTCSTVAECETGYQPAQRPDADGDGYTIQDGDCDDSDTNLYPGAVELCNGIDDNCDEKIDNNCAQPSLDSITGAAIVPEFSTFGILIALLIFAGLAWYVRKNK